MPRDEQPRPHRPGLYADLTGFIDAGGGTMPVSRAELAAATAAVVVQAGRRPGGGDEGAAGERFVALADEVGLDTLAALWRDADPISLPGALWTLYVLRQWCRTDPDEVARLWRAGEPLAAADAAVAGVASYADAADIQRVADAVLAGVYRGDLAVALERAAAFFRVVATGRRAMRADAAGTSTNNRADNSAGHPAARTPDDAAERADRNERAAASLTAAARRWRAGTLH